MTSKTISLVVAVVVGCGIFGLSYGMSGSILETVEMGLGLSVLTGLVLSGLTAMCK